MGLFLSRELSAADEPGFSTFAYGDLSVTALLDAQGTIAPSMLFDRSQEDLKKDLEKAGVKDGAFPSWINAFLVKRGGELFLIDTGTGNPDGVLRRLKEAGFAPEDVDYILLTHFHGDHVGGLALPDGTPVFPKAKIYSALEENDYFLPAQGEAPAGGAALPSLFKPYKEAGSFNVFKQGDEILPGVVTMPIFGHTPGHTGFLFQSSKGPFLFWGDVVHVYLVQFPHPETTISYDVDRPGAAASRKALFAKLVKDEIPVAGAHLPFPGVGVVSAGEEGYLFTPLKKD
ncbi:MAG: MBL fold metallo-hydrolase [Deltaproteobacteria bacterium]|jgi:glyoxylase-like metal-dependent hydrolase (beta-lactamase superfamily II)|nr:MBL fold metallo-hydrolase [Deltaproteobacteria bacterium]